MFFCVHFYKWIYTKLQIIGRIVLFGDSGVGKTSIIQKYIQGSIDSETTSTVGAIFHAFSINSDGNLVTLQVWDTAGQEKYKSLGPVYYRKANAAIAIFDLTHPSTLHSLEDWISTYREYADNPYVVFVGNKADLRNQCTLTPEETNHFAEKYNSTCFWTSALTGLGIDDVFCHLAAYINDLAQTRVRDESFQEQSSNPCC